MDESIFVMKVPDNVGDVVAHLYEHLFIQSFYKFLRQAGHNEAFLCDLQGETFRDTIFLYNNVVDNEVDKLLQQFIDKGAIDTSLINNCIKQLACETGTDYAVLDVVGLEQKIADIHDKGFTQLKMLNSIEHIPKSKTPLKVDKEILITKQPFRSKIVTVNYVLDECTTEEMAIFSNISSALVNLTSSSLNELGAYYSCDVINDESDSRTLLGIDYIMPLECRVDKVHKIVDNILDYDLSNCVNDVERYVRRPYRPAGLVYDYLSLGLKMTRKDLQQILTIDNIKKVWDKIQIYSIDEFEYNGKPKELPLR